MTDKKMNNDTHFREPSPQESSILNRLLEANFLGEMNSDPFSIMRLCEAIDEDGSLEIKSRAGGTAPLSKNTRGG